MKYLKQIIVLQQHIHELQEKGTLILRMIEPATPQEIRIKIDNELNAIDAEVKDTYHAIKLLREAKT